MSDIKWTSKDKTIARRAFDAALERELAAVMEGLKQRAAAATTPDDMWAIEDYLRRSRRGLEEKYDYRYSMLLFLFGRLLREGWLSLDDLAGLGEDKLGMLRSWLTE